MPARKCLGTKKANFQSIIVRLEVSISAKKYRQKIRNGGLPPPLRTMSPIKPIFFPRGFPYLFERGGKKMWGFCCRAVTHFPFYWLPNKIFKTKILQGESLHFLTAVWQNDTFHTSSVSLQGDIESKEIQKSSLSHHKQYFKWNILLCYFGTR